MLYCMVLYYPSLCSNTEMELWRMEEDIYKDGKENEGGRNSRGKKTGQIKKRWDIVHVLNLNLLYRIISFLFISFTFTPFISYHIMSYNSTSKSFPQHGKISP